MDLKQTIFLITLLFYSIDIYSQNEQMKLICQKWEYLESVDPYQGGSYGRADSTNRKFRLFKSNGEYSDYDNLNLGVGMWKFNQDSTKLGTTYTIYNGKEIENKEPISDYRWLIYKLKTDTMILGIQGRHGIVKYTYVSIKNE